MSGTYFWDGKEVIEIDHQVYAGHICSSPELKGLPCVDGYHALPEGRYGRFIGDEEPEWQHVPLEHIPAEFRTHLLLLGVS